jgi:frataxin-like iron-binding protein CyaY
LKNRSETGVLRRTATKCYVRTQGEKMAQIESKKYATLVANAVDQLIDQLPNTIKDKKPIGLAHNNAQFPAVSVDDLIGNAQDLKQCIEDHEDVLAISADDAKNLVARIDFLKTHTLPLIWSASHVAVPAFVLTLEAVKKWILANSVEEGSEELSRELQKQRRRVKYLNATLNDLEPRTGSLSDMVARIESAHDAAEQLPTDLELLQESRSKIQSLRDDSLKNESDIKAILEGSKAAEGQLKSLLEEAESVIEQCQNAYSSATSVGLAAAFTERSEKLNRSLIWWVGGLAVSLVCAFVFGSSHLQAVFKEATSPGSSGSLVGFNLLLALLSVGAPVWFAWLSTKQIGQRFRLAEDYAFKASISRAYEGYRREAARIDPALESQLLQSALNRLDELPLRLVEEQSHGSPWGELLHSPIIREAMKTVPEFASSVKHLAASKLNWAAKGPGTDVPETSATVTVLGKEDGK